MIRLCRFWVYSWKVNNYATRLYFVTYKAVIHLSFVKKSRVMEIGRTHIHIHTEET